MTRIVVVAPRTFASLELLHGIDFIADDDPATLRELVARADAILLAPRYAWLLRGLLPHAKNVKWIHALAAGVDSLPFDALRERDMIVTNSAGLYADALGEFAIAAMLWFAKDLRRLDRNQQLRKWEPYTVDRLEGQCVGIIGYGGIGRAVARRAEALRMRVLSVRRSEGNVDEVMPQSDFVVVSTPLTAATRKLINAARIASMKRTAVLINISRGAVVDEAALIDALREHRIRGAALDVFETEPLPPDSELWSLDNVLVSPHTADHTADSHERAMKFFLENLRRLDRGEKLENIVDLHEGY